MSTPERFSRENWLRGIMKWRSRFSSISTTLTEVLPAQRIGIASTPASAMRASSVFPIASSPTVPISAVFAPSAAAVTA